jgi:hypothetical protein
MSAGDVGLTLLIVVCIERAVHFDDFLSCVQRMCESPYTQKARIHASEIGK